MGLYFFVAFRALDDARAARQNISADAYAYMEAVGVRSLRPMRCPGRFRPSPWSP